MDYKERAAIIKNLRYNPITFEEKEELLEIQGEIESTLEMLKKVIQDKPVVEHAPCEDFSHNILVFKEIIKNLKYNIENFDRRFLLERDYLLHSLGIKDQYKE